MIKNHIIRVTIGCVLGLIAGLVYYFSVPRTYEASTEVFINTQSNNSASEISALLALGMSQSVASEVGLLQSRGTYRRALIQIAERTGNDGLLDQFEDLYKMYTVEAARDSRFVRLVVNAPNPELAADIANELAVVYIDTRRQAGQQSFAAATQFIEEQAASTEQSLKDAERALRDFKTQNRIIDLTTSQGSVASYLATLTQDRDRSRAEEASLVREIQLQRQQVNALPRTVELERNEVKSPAVVALEARLLELENQRTDLLRIFADGSQRIRQIDEIIRQTRQRLADARRSEWEKSARTFQREPVRAAIEQALVLNEARLTSVRSRIRSLDRAYTEQAQQAAQLPERERRLTELTLNRDIFRDKFVKLKSQLEDVRLRSTSGIAQALVLYPAFAQPVPVSPIASRVIPIWLVAGACLALIISLVRESLRTTVRGSAELSAILELPVVATAPALTPRESRRKLKGVTHDRYLPFESFRFMASVLALAGGHRRVLFTSVGGSVGCSSSAIDFSISAARMGVDTTLIDADLKFSTVSRAFGLTEKSGLRDILAHSLLPSGEARITSESSQENLHILPTGSESGARLADTPPSQLAAILETLQEHSKLIVIDCPPFDVLADAARFVPFVDEVCLVVSAGKTHLQAMAVTRDLLLRAGAKNVSLVMTGTQPDEEPFTRRSRYLIEPVASNKVRKA